MALAKKVYDNIHFLHSMTESMIFKNNSEVILTTFTILELLEM